MLDPTTEMRPVRNDWRTLAHVAVTAGLVAALVEIAVVFLIQGLALHVRPVQILQAIASGMLGRRSFLGGAGTAALGGLLHTLISVAAAFVFTWRARARPWLTRHPVQSGLFYGIIVWFLMSYVVVPLSAAAFGSARVPALIAMSIAVHMLAFGLPISLVCRRMLVRAERLPTRAGPFR